MVLFALFWGSRSDHGCPSGKHLNKSEDRRRFESKISESNSATLTIRHLGVSDALTGFHVAESTWR